MTRSLETSKSVASAGTDYLYPLPGNSIVPPSSTLTLRKLGNYLDQAGAWGSVVWVLLRNGIPVYPYENIKDQRGIGNTPSDTEPIVFNGGDEIKVKVTNSYASTCLIGASFTFDLE